MIPGRSSAIGVALTLLAAGATLAPAQSNVEELAARLESSDARTRRDAARALGEEGSIEAVAALLPAARDADRDVRRAVLEALAAVRRPDAAAGLIVLLGDEVAAHRRGAIGGLVDIHRREPPAGRRERAVDWLLRREQEFALDPLRPVEPGIVDALAGRLDDEDTENRRLAAEALGALRATTGAASLGKAAAGDPDGEVRRKAVESLGAIGTEEAGNSLLSLVEDPELQRHVVRALGRMAFPPATPALVAVYDSDPDSDLARDALEGLARIGAAEARGTFYHELSSREARRREYAAEGLGRLEDPTLVDGLIRDFLREEDARVQLAFCFALVRLGQAPFVDRVVLSLSDRRLRDTARQYGLELAADHLDEFLRYLDDPDREIRLELIALLERLGSPAAIPKLQTLGEDPDSEVADRARAAARVLVRRNEAR
ncbi:MAG: HEAT repeat domain-containing protein [Acidobacteriota bacterium]|nr:HEAT repeat domain-containing protein [Acidobacteriota bacterium]